MYPTAQASYENGGELTKIVAKSPEFQTWSLDAKNMPLKADFSSCQAQLILSVLKRIPSMLAVQDLVLLK